MSLSQPPITAEQIEALPPELQTLVIAIINHYEQRIAKLEAELAGFKKNPKWYPYTWGGGGALPQFCPEPFLIFGISFGGPARLGNPIGP